MIDVLYILGRGSKHNDQELRYSLRSLYYNAGDIGKVFIVGNCPDWVQNVTHIPCEDTYFPAQNCAEKIIKCPSDKFLLMNDDFMMMKPFDAENYPYFHRNFIRKEAGTTYGRVMLKTRGYLLEHGHTIFHYGVHCPMVMCRANVLKVYDICKHSKTEKIGYSFRSLYGNIFNVGGTAVEDRKCYFDKPLELNETGCLSLADNCDNMLKFLGGIFKEKSEWEK